MGFIPFHREATVVGLSLNDKRIGACQTLASADGYPRDGGTGVIDQPDGGHLRVDIYFNAIFF